MREYHKKYYKKNKTRLRAYNKEWREVNKEAYKEKSRKSAKESRDYYNQVDLGQMSWDLDDLDKELKEYWPPINE